MKIKIFISSAQKELEDERLALQILLTTDPFLSLHCVPILFEYYPAPLSPSSQPYLDLLNTCQVYLGIIWKKYGCKLRGLSATHHEYKQAKSSNMPILILIKGQNNLNREAETANFINEIKTDKYIYDRFSNSEQLQQKARERLVRHIHEYYHIDPTAEQNQVARQTIKIASAFERQRLDRIGWNDIDISIAKEFVAKAEESLDANLSEKQIQSSLWARGFLWKDQNDQYVATAAGILLMAKDPSVVFPQTRLQLSAYKGHERTHTPLDTLNLRKALPTAIDEAVLFVKKNTRHPLRIVGLNKVELDEYPMEAIREVLVNAIAHRDYEDAGRRVTIDVFSDRIEITSPGNLPGGLTLTRLRKGQARPRSRNPNIAQGLSLLGRMEERGTGIRRMKAAMLNHGLDEPKIGLIDGELVVTLPGPGDDLERIKAPYHIQGPISPAVEAELNERQKNILRHVLTEGKVTSGWCGKTFGITRETAVQDLNALVDKNILKKQGKGRGVHYIQAI